MRSSQGSGTPRFKDKQFFGLDKQGEQDSDWSTNNQKNQSENAHLSSLAVCDTSKKNTVSHMVEERKTIGSSQNSADVIIPHKE